MNEPEQPPDRWSQLGEAAQKSFAFVQQALQPDLGEPEPGKKPWLAALGSLLVPGAGQLYNRQLLRALLWFLLLGGGGFFLLVVYLLAHWNWQIHTHYSAVGYGLMVIYALLACVGAVDAYRTAAQLREGNVVVVYSMKRQLALALAGFVPLVGDLAPEVLVPRGQLEPSLRERLHGLAQKKAQGWLRRWLTRFLVRALLIGAGLLLVAMALLILLLALSGSPS
ncbi:MAG: hypothetical protein AB7K24_04280 [Gemmataceae bacterium]